MLSKSDFFTDMKCDLYKSKKFYVCFNDFKIGQIFLTPITLMVFFYIID